MQTGYAGFNRSDGSPKNRSLAAANRKRQVPAAGHYENAQSQYIRSTYKRATGMVDISMDRMPKIASTVKMANPDLTGDVDDFRARVQYFRFKQGQPCYEFDKTGNRDKGSFIDG